LWGSFDTRKAGIDGGIDQTHVFRASSQPGYYWGSTAGGNFQHFPHFWSSGVRLKRSAQNILQGDPITSTVTASGSLTFFNHNKELDAVFGATGFSTDGESFEIGVTAIPSEYTSLPLGAQTSLLLSGRLGMRTVTDTDIQIPIGSSLDQLDDALATEIITADEYPLAPAAVVGRTIPLLLGTCHGVELILVNTAEQGGRYLMASHPCAGGAFYRNGLAMTLGVEYTAEFDGLYGRAYIILTTGLQGARITGDIQGVMPAHLGGFSDQLMDLNLYILNAVGIDITRIDPVLLAECYQIFPYAMDYPILEETSAKAVWDTLNAGIPLLLEQLRTGQYTLRPWTVPSSDPVVILTDTDLLRHEMTEMEKIGGTILHYAPNATILAEADVAGILLETNPDRVAILAQAFQTLTVRIPGAHAHQVLHTATTRLIHRADAEALAALRNTLFGRPRIQHKVTVGSFGAAVTGLGDVVQIVRPRLRLNQLPGLARVADIEEEWNSGGVAMTLLLVEEAR
jgi:hypothetical protein